MVDRSSVKDRRRWPWVLRDVRKRRDKSKHLSTGCNDSIHTTTGSESTLAEGADLTISSSNEYEAFTAPERSGVVSEVVLDCEDALNIEQADAHVLEGEVDHDVHESSNEDMLKPMWARLDALQMQQELQGMDHPDVIFSLRHLGRAHRRRGELQQAKLVEEMIHATAYDAPRLAWD